MNPSPQQLFELVEQWPERGSNRGSAWGTSPARLWQAAGSLYPESPIVDHRPGRRRRPSATAKPPAAVSTSVVGSGTGVNTPVSVAAPTEPAVRGRPYM